MRVWPCTTAAGEGISNVTAPALYCWHGQASLCTSQIRDSNHAGALQEEDAGPDCQEPARLPAYVAAFVAAKNLLFDTVK